jgi:hypothetical protein
MSNSNIYTVGLNNVGSFQVSGIPYVTSSFDPTGGLQVNFPFVTRWVVVSYSGSTATKPTLKLGFSQHGLEGNSGNFFYNMAPNTTTPRLEMKVTQLFLSGGEADGVSIMAGLTNLPVSRVDNIAPSGSNWSGSIGVG